VSVDPEQRARLEELAGELGPTAYRVAVRLLGDPASAEDAMQDAYLQAYRGLAGYRGEASLKTWFLRILVNRCHKLGRGLGRRRLEDHSVELLDGLAEESGQPGSDPWLRRQLDLAVAGLPPRQQTAFVLRYGEDLSLREVAEVMGCAEGTVKATLHKAVAKLREVLTDLAPEGST